METKEEDQNIAQMLKPYFLRVSLERAECISEKIF